MAAGIVGIIRERYSDFGPTLAAEKLAELHDIHLARETVRQWMITAGVLEDRPGRVKAGYPPPDPRGFPGAPVPDHGVETPGVRALGRPSDPPCVTVRPPTPPQHL